MIENSCLFLKPQVTPTEDRNQKSNIDTFIKPAIKQAGLQALDENFDGVEVSDISMALIQKVHDAQILVIDANYYETAGLFQFSPYLYYFMALGHSWGNRTILVADAANARLYLSDRLRGNQTLFYSLNNLWVFIDQFKKAVSEIRQQQDSWPDNPIQDYLSKKAAEEARALLAATIAEKEALKAEKEALKTQQRGNQPPARIIFREVNPQNKG